MATEVLPDLGTHFHEPVSWHVWDAKYRYREGNVVRDQTIEDTWRRVARALAAAEPESERARWPNAFTGYSTDSSFCRAGASWPVPAHATA
nr:hypothetical protein [Rhodothermus marinus]